MAFIIPFIPTIIAAVGTAFAVKGSVDASKQAKKQGQAQQSAGDVAAANAEQESAAAVDSSVRDEEALRRSSRMEIGRSAAALAEAGISPDGSTGLALDQSVTDAEYDALKIRYGGQLASRGLLSQAAEYRTQGRAAAAAGRAGGRTGLLLAGAQLLQGGYQTYKTYASIPTA